MTAVTIYGVIALTFMLVMYALEGRGRGFVLAFAVGCVLSAVYGFLAGAWPFGVVELIWAVVALRRWSTSGVLRPDRTRSHENRSLGAQRLAAKNVRGDLPAEAPAVGAGEAVRPTDALGAAGGATSGEHGGASPG